jgi:hypothetical protein
MLPVIVLTLAVVFILLWKLGYLDELQARGQAKRGGRPLNRLERGKGDPASDKRLEIFERFLEDLGEDDEE